MKKPDIKEFHSVEEYERIFLPETHRARIEKGEGRSFGIVLARESLQRAVAEVTKK